MASSPSSLLHGVAILALICCSLSCSAAAGDVVALDGRRNQWKPPPTPLPGKQHTPVSPVPTPATPVPGRPVTPNPPVSVPPPPSTPVRRYPVTPSPSTPICVPRPPPVQREVSALSPHRKTLQKAVKNVL
ncbi:hypothetical protein TRIUR3_07206 [Triticum urartu]|uniref:Uncharacterized protein n=1 Tax=Triticum urartu TaxID=4572 RepID=M8A9D5_TRIUA|nr:vegetative cell wall protein gp1-like [Triticum urartu]EMS61285.1 hypothetical protein TRIUR3_07206 [Triticum urartu]